MKVLKFGGTSVGTPEAVLQVKQIVDRLDAPAVVVVSALGGVTDCLITLSAKAVDPTADYLPMLDELHARHDQMVRSVLPPDRREESLQGVSNCFDELSRILQGVRLIGELTPKTADAIVAYGARLSSSILAALLISTRGTSFARTPKAENTESISKLRMRPSPLPTFRVHPSRSWAVSSHQT